MIDENAGAPAVVGFDSFGILEQARYCAITLQPGGGRVRCDQRIEFAREQHL